MFSRSSLRKVLLAGCAALVLPLALESCGRGKDDDSVKRPTGEIQSQEGELDTLARYTIAGTAIKPQKLDLGWSRKNSPVPDISKRPETHQMLWQKYAELVPDYARSPIAEFWIFTDGAGGRDAFVEIDKKRYQRFALGVDALAALPISDPTGTKLAQSYIHEQAHVLSLSADQVEYDRSGRKAAALRSGDPTRIDAAIRSCGGELFVLEGCTKSNSYLSLFAKEFWGSDVNRWYETLKLGQIQMEGLYNERPDSFVSVYAAANPGEDFAESWLAYVTGPAQVSRPGLAGRKIAFFNRYPALRRLRGEIRVAYKARY